jgi:hypothetical protein
MLVDHVRALAERVALEQAGSRWPSARWSRDPVGFSRVILGVEPWSFQVELLEAIRDNRHVAISSGRKCGKDHAVACAALWWFASFELARVILIAPSAKQLDGIAYREIRMLFAGSGRCLDCKRRDPTGPTPCPHSAPLSGSVGTLARTGIRTPDFREIVGFTAVSEGGLRGMSGARILAIEDEASDIKDEFDRALVGNLAAADCHRVLISNPTRTQGFFFDAFHTQRNLFHTITRSSETTPNVVEGREVVRGLATRQWLAEREIAWGRGSVAWAANVEGRFPTAEDGQLFTLETVSSASARWASTPAEGRLAIGLDVAGETGDGDETVFCVRRGRRVIELVAARGLSPDAVLERLLGLLARHRDERQRDIDRASPPLIVIDRDGATGARVFDTVNGYRRNHEGAFKLVGFRGSPPHPNPKIAESFRCLRDCLFASLLDWIREGGAIPADLRLEGEMLALRWAEPDARGRSQIVRKSELRDRLGRSPDRLDALALSTWLGTRREAPVEEPSETIAPLQYIDPSGTDASWGWDDPAADPYQSADFWASPEGSS